jgi:hypothetical protein
MMQSWNFGNYLRDLANLKTSTERFSVIGIGGIS